MRKLLLLAIAGIFGSMLFMLPGRGDDSDTLRIFMRAKLDHSKKILEGLPADIA